MKSCQLLGIEPRAFVLSHQCISTELQQLDKYQPPWLIPGMLYGPIRLHPCKAHKGPAHYYLEIMNGQLKTMKQLWELIVKNKIRSHDHHCEVTWSPLRAHMITIVRSHDHHCELTWSLCVYLIVQSFTIDIEQRRVSTEARPKHYITWEFQLWVLDWLFLKRSGVLS